MQEDSGFRIQDSDNGGSYLHRGHAARARLNPESRILNPCLLIGYGNPYRRDDGVAFHIINAVRARLDRPPLPQDDTGEDDLGHPVDTVMAHQLVPELAPLLQGYDRVLFVDAHAGSIPEQVRLVRVEPDATLQATTHHFGPGLLLHLAAADAGSVPEGWLLSVRGYDFDFGDDLSEPCAALLPEAVVEAMRLLRTR